MIIKTYTKLCFYLYDLLGGQSGTERLILVIIIPINKMEGKNANICFIISGAIFATLFLKVYLEC